jgi:hypothetical protein
MPCLVYGQLGYGILYRWGVDLLIFHDLFLIFNDYDGIDP